MTGFIDSMRFVSTDPAGDEALTKKDKKASFVDFADSVRTFSAHLREL